MIWSLWPSMIQFDWPNHVQKTRKPVTFLQESILLTPRKFIRSVSCSAWRPKLRSTARSAASSQVIFVPLMSKLSPNDVDLEDDMSPNTLVLLRSSRFNFVRFFRANRSPETSLLVRRSSSNFVRLFKAAMSPENLVLRRSSCVNSLRFCKAAMSPETWVHPRLSFVNFLRFFNASMSPETWVAPRLRTCRSGNWLKRELRVPVSSRSSSQIFTTLQPSLGG